MSLLSKIQVSGWLKLALKIVPLLPVPIWVKAIDAALVALIDRMPKDQAAQARVELDSATLQAVRTNSHAPIAKWMEKHCDGVACPADLVRE